MKVLQNGCQALARLTLVGGTITALNYLIGPAAPMEAEAFAPWGEGPLAAVIFGPSLKAPLVRSWQLYHRLGQRYRQLRQHHLVQRLMTFAPPGAKRLVKRLVKGVNAEIDVLNRQLGQHRLGQRLMTFAPPSAKRLVEGVKAEIDVLNRRRLTPEKELTEFYRAALQRLVEKQGAAAIGDYLEFGVYNGTSLICMYRALTQLGLDHVRLFGFDSFEGLPPDEEGHWGPGGRFKSELEFTRRVLAHEGVPNDRVVLIKGFFSDSLKPELITQYQITRASIIMVDVDMYRSTCEALQFCERLIAPEALMVFDDWHPLAEKNMGEKRAFDEFLQAHPSLHPTPYGSTYHWHAEAFWVTRSSKGAAKETTS
jgi:O-methyltransferase